MKKIVLFGAGKIGRSFIAQLFALSGFEVVFVDISESLIRELNRQRDYQVVIKSELPDVIIRVGNVRGLLAAEEDKVAEEISLCDIAAISVGPPRMSIILLLDNSDFINPPLKQS